MKFFISFLFAFNFVISAFGQGETKTFLLNKEKYKLYEEDNVLLSKAIENVFGIPNKQNYYTLYIAHVGVWSDKVDQFTYYPYSTKENKKSELKSSILTSKENVSIKMRVNINFKKSQLNAAIEPLIDESYSFTLNIIVVGDPHIFVTETQNKTAFLNIIDERSFTEKAFTKFFGENPNKINYNISFNNMNACLIKDVLQNKCIEQFDGSSYDKFSDKVTSAEYSNGYILIDLHILRDRSKLTQAIESALIKENDGTEHLKFYFCIPKDNLRPKKKKQKTIEGKIVSGSKVPVKGLLIYLRDNLNTVVATQTTDNYGLFKFDKIEEGSTYSFFIDKSCKESELLLFNKQDQFLGKYTKTDIGFIYKLVEADIVQLSQMEDKDPAMQFLVSFKGRMLSVTDKTKPLINQLIELKNSGNQVVQSQKTDNQGNFEFKQIDSKNNYSIGLPEYISISKTEKVYMANSKNELVREFKKGSDNKFSYKIVPADIHLLSEMNDGDVEMTFSKQQNTNNTEIVIQDFVYFGLNSFQVSGESKPVLDKIAKIISENTSYKMDIISHTDCRGDKIDNQKLSEKRSEAVLNYLVTKNIEAKRLKSIGMGESKPLNNCIDGSNCIEEEYKMNRRTQFRFYK